MLRRLLIIVLLITVFIRVGDASLKVGFITLGEKGAFTKLALGFAKDTFQTQQLNRKDLKSGTFKDYGVIWWHDGDTDGGDLKDAEINAFMDYAKAGGAILLTGWAIRSATPMGLEDAVARQFGPQETDGIAVGITVTKKTKELKLLTGLKNLKGNPPGVDDRVQVNSTGYPKSGDYYDKIWKNFITVANAWGPPANDWTDRIAAFGYWKAGSGKVFNMNWRLPNYHKNNKDINQLYQLTKNVIEWLASESEFAAVSWRSKITTSWGEIKSLY
ncbi:TPA: hypothetical protein EYN98_30530 [Candidatus Poribacteria bacterium]|nr:hypothetical protein [Candidatus Poribacteria bacterium]HIA70306.1 hypothetical protein [Candidatus Poribacteria bacterium]HIC00489.1 hypothetical protein [Candidatus Poribacteria bacterium]